MKSGQWSPWLRIRNSLGGELQPRLAIGHLRRADKIKSPEVVLGSFVSASSSL
jgi:hypothetical protein